MCRKYVPDTKKGIPDLVRAFEDSNWCVCEAATEALGKIGSEAKEAIQRKP